MISKVFGIDLGTTNSLIARRDHQRTEVVPDSNGSRLIPTVVSFTNKERIIGTLAKSQITNNSENTIFGTKRLIGRTFTEEVVQESIKKWPFKVIQDGKNTLIEVHYLNKRETFPPEAISAMVLAKLKENAEAYFDETVTDAVISVPAAFKDGQRQATRDAGKIAGLNVIRIINEPTAAAIAYGLNNSDKMDDKYVLVYDLGGGTFDVSILKITNNTFDVIVSKGDLQLGGDDFDEKIKDIIMEKFTKKNEIVEISDKRAALRLMRECEIAKHNLSHHMETDVEIDNFFNKLDLSETISRVEFEKSCNQMFNKTIALVKETLTEANLKASDIHDVVLVGGSSRIPKIRGLLRNVFEGMTLKESINPDEAVVEGAAIQAYLLSGMNSNKDAEIVVIESINASLGINIIGERMSTIINRGAKIPIKKMKNYTTTADKQTKSTIKIFEGERPMLKDNHYLCEFKLNGIPPKAPGVETYDVTFEVDKDLILHAWALIKLTKQETIPITKEAGRMSQDKIEHHINEAKMFKEKDMMEYARVTAKANLEIRVYSLMATGNSHEISEATAMLKWLEEHQDEKQEEYEANLEKLA